MAVCGEGLCVCVGLNYYFCFGHSAFNIFLSSFLRVILAVCVGVCVIVFSDEMLKCCWRDSGDEAPEFPDIPRHAGFREFPRHRPYRLIGVRSCSSDDWAPAAAVIPQCRGLQSDLRAVIQSGSVRLWGSGQEDASRFGMSSMDRITTSAPRHVCLPHHWSAHWLAALHYKVYFGGLWWKRNISVGFRKYNKHFDLTAAGTVFQTSARRLMDSFSGVGGVMRV